MYWATGRLLHRWKRKEVHKDIMKHDVGARKQDEVKLVQEENQEFLFVCIRHRIFFAYLLLLY
jgi:hypothetical protein